MRTEAACMTYSVFDTAAAAPEPNMARMESEVPDPGPWTYPPFGIACTLPPSAYPRTGPPNALNVSA